MLCSSVLGGFPVLMWNSGFSVAFVHCTLGGDWRSEGMAGVRDGPIDFPSRSTDGKTEPTESDENVVLSAENFISTEKSKQQLLLK